MKVLLVEENSPVRSLVRQLVMSPGTWIHECGRAADAAAAYAASRPDCVIMGIGTRDPDGIAVSRQIREMDPGARIILVSDYDDAAMRESARDAGACGYVLKDNLLEVVGLLRRRQSMSVRINDEAPNFSAETTQGTINFHEWIGNGWAVLFSHPKDFTPVCTTELGYMAGLAPEFAKRNCKIIGLSVDPVSSHGKWAVDIEETQGHKVNYPMIGDPELKVAKLYDMLPSDAGTTSEGRTAANNATVRTVFVIGPDKKVKLMLVYPMSTGRNFDEVLRVLDSLQLTAKHQVSTPVNWKPGEDVIISGNVSNEEAQKKYPAGWKTPKPYIRIVAQPK